MTTTIQIAVNAESAGRKAFHEHALNQTGVRRMAREIFPSELERDAFVSGYNMELWSRWGRGPNG